jgi:hypothetical protein
MASELYVETLKGLTSGANANKVIIPSGQTLYAPGHVLQVLQDTDAVTQDFTSSTYSDTNLSLSITPSSASSKILIYFNIAAMYIANGTTTACSVRLTRGGTSVYVADVGSGYNLGTNGNGFTTAGCFLDSPSSTSAQTYVVQVANTYGAGTASINESFNSTTGTSTLTLMEIAG